MPKTLVLAPNWLGDAVMCTPFLRRLARSYGTIDIAARASVAEVFRGFPGLGELTLLARDGADAGRLRKRHYDAAYILPNSFAAAWLAFSARIPRRIGYAVDARRALLTEAPRLDERYHYVRRYQGLLGEEGQGLGRDGLYISRASPADTDRFLAERGITAPFIAVAPGSRAPARRWPAERFAALLAQWSRSPILLMGAAEDRPAAEAVAKAAGRPAANLCGQTPLALAAALLAKAELLITNESGLMHVGWAVGTPLVVLAGPSDTQLTSPFGANVRVIQHREVPCVPCVRNQCYRAGEEYKLCLGKISVEEAAEQANALAASESLRPRRE